jgi:Flp pilus assembly secretin CpaC
VLDGSRINLKFVSEASELQQTGSRLHLRQRRHRDPALHDHPAVDTTVQLRDGQSFMVAA